MSSDSKPGQELPEKADGESEGPGSTRRNFSRGAAGGAVLMTLGSAVAWGGYYGPAYKALPVKTAKKCISTAVLMSVTPSSHHHLAKKGQKSHAELRDAYNSFLSGGNDNYSVTRPVEVDKYDNNGNFEEKQVKSATFTYRKTQVFEVINPTENDETCSVKVWEADPFGTVDG